MAAPRRPPALKHGLTSHYARGDWSAEVNALAEAILGAAPREPNVVEAARAEAEAILYLRRVRQCRLQVLEGGTLQRATPTERERALALKLSEAVKCADVADCNPLREKLRAAHDAEWIVGLEIGASYMLIDEIGKSTKALRRLNDYERRAQSRWRKSRRQFDYERIEAQRRQSSRAASPRPERP